MRLVLESVAEKVVVEYLAAEFQEVVSLKTGERRLVVVRSCENISAPAGAAIIRYGTIKDMLRARGVRNPDPKRIVALAQMLAFEIIEQEGHAVIVTGRAWMSPWELSKLRLRCWRANIRLTTSSSIRDLAQSCSPSTAVAA